jgi:3-oxoacyl-[acyl-carrier protein] reductase
MVMTETQPEARTAGGKRLEGQVAIITGGAQGIGRATAELFAAEGAKLVLCDMDGALVEKTAAEIGAVGSAVGIQANVTRMEDAERVVQAALDKFGRIDILVNNAGITKDNLLLRMTEQEWDAVLDVNLKGAFCFAKVASKAMLKARKGAIVNIASVVGQEGNIGQANYAASKAGLIGFTKALAKELASRNIRVNCVAPGFIKTRLTDVLPEEAKKRLAERILLGRLGEPADIAKAVLFLSSEEASYITGHVLGVNGGLYV